MAKSILDAENSLSKQQRRICAPRNIINSFYLVTDKLQQLGVPVTSDLNCKTDILANMETYLLKSFGESASHKLLGINLKQDEISVEEIEALHANTQ